MKPRVELDDDGRVVRAWVPSKSEPGKEPYELERSVRGAWMHVDARCRGYFRWAHCYHERSLSMVTEDTTALVVMNPLELIEAADDQAIITRLESAGAAAVATWCYEFKQDGQPIVGLSIDGVKEAAREMSRRGEPIDEVWTRIDKDASNEYEVCFMSKAVRFAVSMDGRRVEMDSAIRGTRIEKFYKTDGSFDLKKPNRYWYQQGLAKAARNATEALLPEGIKSWMIATAKGEAGRTRSVTPAKPSVSQPSAAQSAQRRAAQQPKGATVGVGHPKQRVIDLMKKAKAEMPAFDRLCSLLNEAWPQIVGEDGSVGYSVMSDADAIAIGDFVAKALDGVVETVDAVAR